MISFSRFSLCSFGWNNLHAPIRVSPPLLLLSHHPLLAPPLQPQLPCHLWLTSLWELPQSTAQWRKSSCLLTMSTQNQQGLPRWKQRPAAWSNLHLEVSSTYLSVDAYWRQWNCYEWCGPLLQRRHREAGGGAWAQSVIKSGAWRLVQSGQTLSPRGGNTRDLHGECHGPGRRALNQELLDLHSWSRGWCVQLCKFLERRLEEEGWCSQDGDHSSQPLEHNQALCGWAAGRGGRSISLRKPLPVPLGSGPAKASGTPLPPLASRSPLQPFSSSQTLTWDKAPNGNKAFFARQIDCMAVFE